MDLARAKARKLVKKFKARSVDELAFLMGVDVVITSIGTFAAKQGDYGVISIMIDEDDRKVAELLGHFVLNHFERNLPYEDRKKESKAFADELLKLLGA